jgi:hypothetical protein
MKKGEQWEIFNPALNMLQVDGPDLFIQILGVSYLPTYLPTRHFLPKG